MPTWHSGKYDLALLDRAVAGGLKGVEDDANISSGPSQAYDVPNESAGTQVMPYPARGLVFSRSPTLASTPKGLEGVFRTKIHMLRGRSSSNLSLNLSVAWGAEVQA